MSEEKNNNETVNGVSKETMVEWALEYIYECQQFELPKSKITYEEAKELCEPYFAEYKKKRGAQLAEFTAWVKAALKEFVENYPNRNASK